jgi:two-component system sensor histidine kinase/response regulator
MNTLEIHNPLNQQNTRQSTILIIEDESEARKPIADILRFEGYSVLETGNPRQGLLLAGQTIPDLVLCDINLPEMDGFEMIQAFRKLPHGQNIPFVFLTARSEKKDQRYGMGLGAEDYLIKPVIREDLLQTVKIQIKKYKNRLQNEHKKIEEAKMEVSSSLPHELLSPLNGIISLSEMLENEGQKIPLSTLHTMGRTIRLSSERLINTVKKFLL